VIHGFGAAIDTKKYSSASGRWLSVCFGFIRIGGSDKPPLDYTLELGGTTQISGRHTFRNPLYLSAIRLAHC